MKNILNKKENREKVVIKITFYISFFIFIFVIFLAFLNIDLENVCMFECTKFIQDVWIYSFIFITLLPIFFVKNYYKWRHIAIYTLILAGLNLLIRPRISGLDYLLIGPRPTTIYIYIISTVVSIFYIYKERRQGIIKNNL